jgi:hypothetical protein
LKLHASNQKLQKSNILQVNNQVLCFKVDVESVTELGMLIGLAVIYLARYQAFGHAWPHTVTKNVLQAQINLGNFNNSCPAG